MMEDLALQPQPQQPSKKPSIELPRVALRVLARPTKDFEALFGIPDLPLARRYLREQLYHQGFRDEVLAAMDHAPRHVFAPARACLAYVDIAIDADYVFVQAPSTVATIVSTLPGPDTNVLELGTGAGYQSAVLAAFGAQVTSIDSREDRQQVARERFEKLELQVQTLIRDIDPIDGLAGPYDLIVVNEALGRLPRRLVPLLRDGGSVVAPVANADGTHRLMRYLRSQGQYITAIDLGPCFAPTPLYRRRAK